MSEEISMSMGQRFWSIIVSPVKTFKSIGENPQILFPALIMIVLYTLTIVLILPETKEFTREMLMKNPNFTPEMLEAGLKSVVITAVIGALLVPPLIWLVQAVVLVIFNQFSIGQANFKQLYAVSIFAWLPVIIGAIVKSVMVKFMGMKAITSIKTSLALVLPSDTNSGYLFNALNSVDLFVVWGLILLSLGGAVVMNKDSKKVGLYIFGLWVLYTAVKVVVATKFAPAAGL
ncbi:YIP1 family protein [Syntrophomonas palmitatica]|uniref:YIP1 family protein n=1 Tax=Syntrophomonas palmitatica TaxID=402877 RepID=UPI0006D04BB6|nr:YIP1 family protein [Syntrophomonas palmitatica]